MVQAVITNTIPGIDALDLEQREREKYGGGAVPTYEGEARPKRAATGQVGPLPLPE